MTVDDAVKYLTDYFNDVLVNTMASMPVVNSKLFVECVGFRLYEGNKYVGVLITPWFMNLIVIPVGEFNKGELDIKSVGKEISLSFPSGKYRFLTQASDKIGFYLSCSLFSPMFGFSSHDDAFKTAQEIMNQLFTNESNTRKSKSLSRRDFLRGRI